MKKLGRPKVPKSEKHVGIRITLSPPMLAKLRKMSKFSGVSMSGIIDGLIKGSRKEL